MKMTRKLQREWLKGEQRLVKGLSVGALALALSFTVMPPVWASTITASDSFYQSTIQRKDNVYNISEQKHPLRPLLLVCFQHFSAVICRSMNI